MVATALGILNDGTPFLTRVGIDQVTPPSITITDTNFHHLAVTKNGSSVIFYVDGVAYTAPTYVTTYTFSYPSAAVGARGDNFENSFLGSVDEVSVYNRALLASEIQSIYNADEEGKCSTGTPPAITSHPQDRAVLAGNSTTFNVIASGTQPLSYQWLFNGTNIGGATASSLMLSNVQAANAGLYSVIVSNLAGTATSSNAALAVITSPSCVAPPSGLVSWWRAEGNAFDQTGTNNGTLAGNTTYGSGRVNQAFVFDGNGDGF